VEGAEVRQMTPQMWNPDEAVGADADGFSAEELAMHVVEI
jgi:hypothetical protein